MNYLFNLLDTTVWDLYTSEADSIVYQWTDNEGWDTFYWFNAVPGDRAYPPGMGPMEGNGFCSMYEVVDTALVVIDGHTLRQVTCAFLDQSGIATTDVFSLTELLGAGSMHFPEGGCFVSEAGWGLHTYDDDDLLLYDIGDGSNCDHFSGIAEDGKAMTIVVYPNPGTGQLTVVLPHMPLAHRMRLYDALGQGVLSVSLFDEQTRVDVSALTPGMYAYCIEDATGRPVASGTWVKQ